MNIAEYSNIDACWKQVICNSKNTLNLHNAFFWRIHLALSWKTLTEAILHLRESEKEEKLDVSMKQDNTLF